MSHKPYVPRKTYTWERFKKDKGYMAEVMRRGIRIDDIHADIEAKRAALKILYSKINANGGESVLVDDAKPERIGEAARNCFNLAKRRVAAYQGTLDYWINRERENALAGNSDEAVGERIAIMLDSCTPKQLAEIARKYGKGVLGGYARYLPL